MAMVYSSHYILGLTATIDGMTSTEKLFVTKTREFRLVRSNIKQSIDVAKPARTTLHAFLTDANPKFGVLLYIKDEQLELAKSLIAKSHPTIKPIVNEDSN